MLIIEQVDAETDEVVGKYDLTAGETPKVERDFGCPHILPRTEARQTQAQSRQIDGEQYKLLN